MSVKLELDETHDVFVVCNGESAAHKHRLTDPRLIKRPYV